MRKALVTLSSMLVAVGAFAQGQVNFAARIVGLYDAPVFVVNVASGIRADGRPQGSPALMVQLYAGATQASLAPIGAALPFLTGADAGYWTAEARTITTVDATGNAFVQVRAWALGAGATYESASATGCGFGASNILTVKPTAAPEEPASLAGLQSFAISTPGLVDKGGPACSSDVPEPSTMALGALGSLALLLGRPKLAQLKQCLAEAAGIHE